MIVTKGRSVSYVTLASTDALSKLLKPKMSSTVVAAINGTIVPFVLALIACKIYSVRSCTSVSCQVTPVAVPVFIIFEISKLDAFTFLLKTILNSIGRFRVGSAWLKACSICIFNAFGSLTVFKEASSIEGIQADNTKNRNTKNTFRIFSKIILLLYRKFTNSKAQCL